MAVSVSEVIQSSSRETKTFKLVLIDLNNQLRLKVVAFLIVRF